MRRVTCLSELWSLRVNDRQFEVSSFRPVPKTRDIRDNRSNR